VVRHCFTAGLDPKACSQASTEPRTESLDPNRIRFLRDKYGSKASWKLPGIDRVVVWPAARPLVFPVTEELDVTAAPTAAKSRP
jgi:hypothetical protein